MREMRANQDRTFTLILYIKRGCLDSVVPRFEYSEDKQTQHLLSVELIITTQCLEEHILLTET